MAAFEKVPLYLRKVVLAGYPCLDWMMDGIERGPDCKLSGVFGPGIDSIVGGCSCDCGRGIHIREDKYNVEILDDMGRELPDGQYGRILVYPNADPEARFLTRSYGSIMTQRCPCGNPAPKIIGMDLGIGDSAVLHRIAENLLYWNSILDCAIKRTSAGLEVEIVCFRGEKMPELPKCAKLVVRAWNPETDVPFISNALWEIS